MLIYVLYVTARVKLKHIKMFLQIAPPVLHLNLGIFQKMFELMVSHYHKIDVLLLRMKTFDEPDVTDITLFAK